MPHGAVRALNTEALSLNIAPRCIQVGDAVDDLVHQRGLKHLVGVVLHLELQLLVKVGEAVAQGAGWACKGAVRALPPMRPTIIPDLGERRETHTLN